MRHILAVLVVLFGFAGAVKATEILDNEKMIKLAKSGLEEDIILKKLDRDTCNFNMSTDEIVKLKEAGVSGRILMKMMEKMDTQVNKIRVDIEMQVQILRTSNADEYAKAVKKLKAYGAQAVPVLAGHLADTDEVIRAGVAEALGEIGDASARPMLMDALNDDHPTVRIKAGKAVSAMSDAETADKLLKWIKTPGHHRDGACLALGYLRDKQAVEPLTALLDDHLAADDDRAAAVFALGLIGDAGSLDKLMDALLNSPSDKVRENAAKAVGRIGPYAGKEAKENAAKTLTRAYERYPQNRAVIAAVLGDFALGPVIETLIDGLQDNNPEVSDACYKSLRAITGETLGRTYDEWSSWWALSKVRYQVQ